jgi:hypothetical protein
MSVKPAPEAPFALVGRVEGQIDKGKYAGTYQIPKEVKPADVGEWEYVLVVKVPSVDLEQRSNNVLGVKIEGDRWRIDVQLDPDDPAAFDDKVTLEGDDGYSQTLGIVSEGKLHAHAQGMTTVIFEGVKVGAKYTCTVDPGKSGTPYKLFVDHELKANEILPKTPGGDTKAGGGGAAPAPATKK